MDDSRSPIRRRQCRHRALSLLLATVVLLGLAQSLVAQTVRDIDEGLIDRPISAITFEGIERVDRQLIANNIRAAVGDPFDPTIVRSDVSRLYQLGRFRFVTARAELLQDGSVHVIYEFQEQPSILEIQVVGNSLISDQELLQLVPLVRGGPRDDYLIQSAVRAMEEKYRQRGHYLVSVEFDDDELEESGILLFRVIEGPRVRIRAIEYHGNEAFHDRQLNPEISTRTAVFFFRRGELDEERLADDVAALNRFYRERGYLDVRVDRSIQLSPDNREAKVTFLIDEGPQYLLRRITTEAIDGSELQLFTPEQLTAMLEINPGDVFRQDLLRQSIDAIRQAYGRIGRFTPRDQTVEYEAIRVGEQNLVDLLLMIDEGEVSKVGLVHVQGNFLTKDKVIRRHVRLHPGRPLDATELERSRRRIADTRLFNDVRLTVQDPDPRDPQYRDVLVEIRERNTGSINFGAAIGSDAGVFGEFSLQQDNFDVADLPESFGELIRGRAFRGAGQRFNMTFRPGTELFQYAASITEPHLFESDYSLRVGGSFLQRIFRRYDEQRISGNIRLGRQFGDVWAAALSARVDRVKLFNFDDRAPTEFFLDRGPDLLTGLGVSLTRTTIPTITRPGRGSRFEFAYERVGALGGDFNFNRISSEYTVFFTLDEDFLGRKSTLRLNTEVGYLFGGDRVPTYERFFRGGRSFRGFRFREIAPKGIRADTGEPSSDAVGGEWMFFAGAQYEFPLFGEMVTGVFFVDSGTVTESVGFEDYRVSIGTGIRLYIPQFGPVPIAFDFGIPVRRLDSDRTQLLSFSAELPF